MSLRTRLLLGTAMIALVLLTAAAVMIRTTRDHLVGQVDDQLAAAEPRIFGGAGPGPGFWERYGTGEGTGEADSLARLSTLYVGVLDDDGTLYTVVSPDLRADVAVTPLLRSGDVEALRSGEHVTVDTDIGEEYRLVANRNGRGGLVVLGLSLADVNEAVRRLVAVSGLAVMAIGIVLALVTWWVIRLGVRPLRQMTATAAGIAAGSLSQRVPEAQPGTEAGELGAALNGMLGRIEGAFEQREQSERRLRQFVADASHELRTPVTTIRGYAELYRKGALDDDADLAEAMRRTEAEAIRMGGLVDDLLRLARLDQGRPLQVGPVDLSTLTADAVADGRARDPERTIELRATPGVTVEGDEDGLRQVVANLISNALLHAPGAKVDVSVTRGDGEATVMVVDDGPGMAPEDRDRALERFYRADVSRSRHHGGSGLGLSIVDATVRAHGGRVAVESTLGEGTRVSVALPVRSAGSEPSAG